MRSSDASSSCADVCGQNSHHSLLAIVTSSRGQRDAAKSSPKTTSEYPVGIGAEPLSSL